METNTPKPAAAAITDIVDEIWNRLPADEFMADYDEVAQSHFRQIKKLIDAWRSAAAIQRGDGQSGLPVVAGVQTSTPAHSLDQNFMLVHGTPPAAKPNETSGATPRTDAYFKAESEADEESNLPTHREFMEALELELQHEKSFGSNLRFEAERDAARAVAEVRRQEISELRTELNAVRAAGAWQDIETAPKDQTRILCSYRGNRPFIARWRNDFSVFMDDWDSWRDATHWMPLPRPSAVKQEQTGGAT